MLAALLALSLDIARLLHGDVVAGEWICDAAGLRTFYARREHRPAWDARSTTALLAAIDALAEEGLELALYLLRDQPQWTAAAIGSAIEAGSERSIRLTTPQPVYVLYWTAWVGDDGHMEFHRDHYERDAAPAAALK